MTDAHPRPDWHADWDPLMARIGQDLFHLPVHRAWGSGHGDIVWGADPVEYGTLRRYLEALEFDAPLHCDPESARAQGYADLVLPVTAVTAFSLPPVWRPGEPSVFVDENRNAQPTSEHSSGFGHFPAGPPGYPAHFGTDLEIAISRPAVIGDWIGRHGSRLISVIPKETSVGRGAFVQWEVEFVLKTMEPIGTFRPQIYIYAPFAAEDAA
jgi:hypothetical protein